MALDIQQIGLLNTTTDMASRQQYQQINVKWLISKTSLNLHSTRQPLDSNRDLQFGAEIQIKNFITKNHGWLRHFLRHF